MLVLRAMSKMVFEVRQKSGSLVIARLGATSHSDEPHSGLAQLTIGAILLIAASGLVFFLLVL